MMVWDPDGANWPQKRERPRVLQFPTIRLELPATDQEYVGRHRGRYSLARDLASYDYRGRQRLEGRR